MESVPLSRAQLALWLAQQLNPATPFVVAQYVEFRGAVDADLLARATLIGGHEFDAALIRLVGSDTVPTQLVDRDIDDGLRCIDLSASADPILEAHRWMTERYSRPIDLATDRLMSAALLKLADEHYFWFSHAHHLVLDGYGAMTFMVRVAELYTQLSEGTEPTTVQRLGARGLYDLETTYRASTRFESDSAYWSEIMAGMPEPVRLTDRRGNTVMPQRMLTRAVEPVVVEGIAAAAKRWCTSEVAIIAGAYATYQARMSNSRDVALSLPVSGRTTAAMRNAGGMLANIVPIRVQADPLTTPEDLSRQIAVQIVGALRHQRFRYEDMHENAVSGGTRDSAGPSVNVMMFHEKVRLADVVGKFHVLTSGPVEDLFFSIYPAVAGSDIRIGFEANPTIYTEQELVVHCRQFIRVLQEFITVPAGTRIHELNVLSAQERLELAPNVGPPASSPETLGAILSSGRGGALSAAIRSDGVTLTYRDLEYRSDYLCSKLVELGIGPGDVVAIRAPRSADTVVALHAVVESGAAFMFIDPEYPDERIRFMLEDASVAAVISDAEYRSASSPCAVWIDLCTDAARARDDSGLRVMSRVPKPDDVAYVVYTSGSTGKPKGVAVTHRGVSSLLRSHARRLAVDASSRVAHCVSTAFDVAILEILLAHGTGGTCVVVPRDVIGGDALSTYLRAERVTHLIATPAIPATMDPTSLPDLRRVNVGGERPPREFVQRWSQRVEVLNSYGPTEVTVAAFMSDPLSPDVRPLVGRPLDGVSAVVLDRQLEPAPIGACGELYLSGAGLARGYVARPGLTAERFVASPFGDPGTRMYRTGDLVRWSESYELEFVGRSDRQVKVRGVRVELGEIEAALESIAEVASSLVLERDGSVVSYVVSNAEATGETVDSAYLRQAVASILPRGMVPSAITILPSWPLTANGKIDHTALPMPVADSATSREASDHLEVLIAAIMSDALGDRALGADSDFFASGGNSLAAVHVAAKIREILRVDIGVRELFDDPTPALLARRLHSMRGRNVVCEPHRVPVDVAQEPALAQQRMWLLNQTEPESSAYHIAFEVIVAGALDSARLFDAVAELSDRHQVLRTIYPLAGNRPVHSLAVQGARVRVVPREQYSEASVSAAQRPFDLTREVPLRLVFASMSEDEHRLTVVAHHVAMDGHSLQIVMADLVDAYSGDKKQEHSPDAFEYRDYSHWQRTVLGEPSDSGSLAFRQLAFWEDNLRGLPPVLDLPLDRVRVDQAVPAAGLLEFEIPQSVHRRLAEIAREHNCTTFMAVHAALAILLHKISGADDLAIGTPTSGRTHAAFDSVVGMFVGTLSLRTVIRPQENFTDFLIRVRDVDLAALSHADVPFDWVVDRCAAASDSRHPLFRVLLALDAVGAEAELSLDSITLSGRVIPPAHARFDLEFTLREQLSVDGVAEGVSGSVVFARDILDADTVAEWIARLLRVCEAVTADPSVSIRSVDVLSPVERANLAPEIRSAAPRPALLTEMLLEQTIVHGSNVAISFGDTAMTYAELESRSASLAGVLIEHGIGSGDRVAVAVPRSIELVIALVAVLRSGAAYVPIDLEYPDARIHFVLDDARPVAVLSKQVHAHRLAGTRALFVDVGSQGDPQLTRARNAEPEDPAYVIYTSGSSGTPKGVWVSHGNVAALLAATRSTFDAGPDDVWTMFHSAAFDFSVWELWGALTTGGRVVVVDSVTARSARSFADLLVREGVSILNQTPAAFYALAEVTENLTLPVRLLISGGERLDNSRVAGWLQRHRDTRAVNMFGITETTVHVTAFDISRTESSRTAIGSALPGMRTYVLDASLNPVPPGTVGELYVAGPQVTQGYFGRPALTSVRFVPEPALSGSVMYRSGDLVRSRAGVLHYEGRADQQLTLRGFRIEPAEVESALLGHPGVEQAAVLLRELATGPALVAYIAPGNGVDPDDVLATVRDRLPQHLVPSFVTVLPNLPVTANGKIDHDGLPEPAPHSPRAPHARNPLEQTLAEAFRELLHAEVVDFSRSFFEQGGNSLLATRLSARLSDILDVDVSVRDVFDYPTISELSRCIGTRIGHGRRRSSTVVAHDGDARALSSAQQRMWVLNQFDTTAANYNIPVILRLVGVLDVAALASALRDVVERHHALRTVYPLLDGSPGPHILDVDTAALQLDPVTVDEAEAVVRAAEVVEAGFDVRVDAPIRGQLLRLDSETHLLVLVVHHIAADAWSMDTLLRDTVSAYTARASGAAPVWSPLPLQYNDYALWQQLSETDSDTVEYWSDALEGLPPQVTLPPDRVRPPVPSGVGAVVHIEIPGKLRARLLEVGAAHNSTLFMVLHAGLAALLSRYSGSRDVPIGTVVAGRGDPALDELVGMFADTLVLRTVIDPTWSFVDLLRHVHDQDLAAYTHADMPFDRLVDSSDVARSASYHPLFQVALSLQERRIQEWSTSELSVGLQDPGLPRAKFDLHVDVSDVAEEQRLTLEFVYAAELYEPSTVALFAQRYVLLLEQVSAVPVQQLRGVDLFTEAERRTVALTRGADAQSRSTLASMLMRGLQLAPDAVAISAGTGDLTYREIDEYSDLLVPVLRAEGAGPERVIPWAADRTADSIVRLWAIAKTGAAPGLMDPSQPRSRAAAAFEQTDGLCTSGVSVRADGAAYVVLTSGTTGTPKAVVVTHAGLGALEQDLAARFGAGPASRILHRGAPGFDMTLLEILLAGSAGATIVLASESETSGSGMSELIRRERVTHLCVTPTVLATVTDNDFPSLDTVMVGGERAGAELIDRWAPQVRIVNGYGPAEATMYAVSTHALVAGHHEVPIGEPILGVDVAVLDEHLQPVPPGMVGEIYLAGYALARGYAGQPGLTATRFVAGSDGRRRYRTGDEAAWKPDADRYRLHYRGRNDAQLKVNGVRVEPDEIRAVVLSSVDVDFCESVLTTTDNGNCVLATYVRARPGSSVDTGALRSTLAGLLPSYLVPAVVVAIDGEIPMRNGKFDFRLLDAVPARRREAPRTAGERAVADIYRSVLGAADIGRDSSFFELGGNSLSAVQVITRLADEWDKSIPLRTVFLHPSVAELAIELERADADIRPTTGTVRSGPIALSHSQYRMWVLNRTDTESSAYNLPLALELRGDLDVSALAEAVVDLVERHKILRTRYPFNPPIAEVVSASQVAIERRRISSDSVNDALLEFSSEGFDLSVQLPIRAMILEIGPTHHVLAVCAHHIAADGGSLTPIVGDLLAAYRYRLGRQAALWPVPALQYADFVESERERGVSKDCADHWREALATTGAVSPLAARSAPDEKRGPAGKVEFSLSALSVARIVEYSAARQASVFMAVHAALSVALARMSGDDQIVIATAVDGRRSPAAAEMVGMFVNTVPLSVQTYPDLPMGEFLEYVRDVDVEAFDHADVDPELLSVLLGGQTPQVALAFHNFDVPTVELDGLAVTVRELDTGEAKFDVQVSCAPRSDGSIHCVVTYARNTIHAGTAASLARILQELLDNGFTDPERTVGTLTTTVAPSWIAEPVDCTRTLATIFRQTAVRHADRIAVRGADRALTYRQLDAESDSAAIDLVAGGAGPGAVLEIPAVRGVDYVVRLWAIAKSGAAFAPIDPSLPEARLNHLRQALQAESPVPGTQHADTPAYVIHTSGSSGVPKGVAVTHRGLGPLADTAIARYRVDPDSVILQGYNLSFDAAVLEMLLAFGSGATLVIAPPSVYGGTELQQFVSEHRVTHLLSTPAVLGTMNPRALPSLEVVGVGGDILPPVTARNWSERTLMLNAYGPTEGTVVATLGEVDKYADDSVPIGSPIAGSGAEVLDSRLGNVPWAGVGELYLRGPGLAMGYVGAPGATASAFVAAPGGRRRYRTGDLVQRRTDGTLGFIGRFDRQVQVRGIRVEPAEVEAAVRRVAGIRDAAVVAKSSGTAAFVVAHDISVEMIRRELADVLPPYLVPQRIEIVEALPLTRNGKVDIAMLSESCFGTEKYAAPVTVTEELVTGVMVQHVPGSFGTQHNLFEAGGDSLAAVAVAAQLSSIFGRDISVRTVFENPTVQDLAKWIGTGEDLSSRPALQPRDLGTRVPLAPAQQRLWLANRLAPESAVHNLVFAVKIGDGVDVGALADAVVDVLDRHQVLRTLFPSDKVGAYQLEADSVSVDFDPVTVVDIVEAVTAAAAVPFVLGIETPVRFRLLRDGSGTRVVVLVVHHIAVDGASMTPLLADLTTAYLARAAGNEPVWNELAISYSDYSVWMHHVLGAVDDPSSLAHRQMDYWEEALNGAPELELPVDNPRPLVASGRGNAVTATVGNALYRSLSELARVRGVTVFMLVHSVVAVLLARECDTDDVVVGTAVGLRSEPALQGLVGMMVGTVALRTVVRAHDQFTDVLDEVRRVDLSAMTNADIPFEMVVGRLAPHRRGNRHPLFTVMLAYRRADEFSVVEGFEPLDLPVLGDHVDLDATCGADGASTVSTEFDLTWDVTDTGDALALRLIFATDLFERDTVNLLLDRFVRILEAVAADPGRIVGDIDVLAAEERSNLLCKNPTSVQPQTLAEILASAVQASPDSTALEVAGGSWTYRQLWEQSGALAQSLTARGIGPDDVVAVATGRTQLWIIALWAVTRAGAAWVYLDSAHPIDRLEWVLADSGAVLGLTTRVQSSALPTAIEWLEVDEVQVSPTLAISPVQVRPDNLAYVIYTSGSTGTPKGVAVAHRGLMNVYTAHAPMIGLHPRVLQVASPTFDACIAEILHAAAGSGTLVLAPDRVFGGAELTEFVRASSITHLTLTPTVLASMDPDALHPLAVESMGEPLPEDLAARWSSRHSVVNGYGPTEATIAATTTTAIVEGDVSIGLQIHGTTTLVLDSRLHPVPDGVAGELYLAGDNLARGYVGARGRTAERFVADPYGYGRRMYRTGDVVRRRRSDGVLDFLGRRDSQVQLGGIRVEPAEIDTALKMHPAVTFSATLARTNASGSLELDSYVLLDTAEAEDEFSIALRAFVCSHLPSYLVPRTITVLDTVPLSSSGKLLASQLPVPQNVNRSGSEPPESESEYQVARIFAEVARVDVVGRNENFFGLGGTSMGTLEVASRLRETLGRDVQAQWLFSHPTVSALATRIDCGVGGDPLDTVISLGGDPSDPRPPLFCLHPVSGLAWCYAGLAAELGGRRVYGVQSTGIGEFPGTITALASRYLEAIRAVQPLGHYHLLGWSAGGTVALEMATQLIESGQSVGSLFLLDTLLPEMIESTQSAPSPPELYSQIGLGEYVPNSGSVTFADVASDIRHRTQWDFITGAVLESASERVEKLSRMVRDHVTDTYTGSVDLFVAQQDLARHPDLAGRWAARVDLLRVHYLDCVHSDMTMPAHLSAIARVLREREGSEHGVAK